MKMSFVLSLAILGFSFRASALDLRMWVKAEKNCSAADKSVVLAEGSLINTDFENIDRVLYVKTSKTNSILTVSDIQQAPPFTIYSGDGFELRISNDPNTSSTFEYPSEGTPSTSVSCI